MRLVLALALSAALASPVYAACGGHTASSSTVTTADSGTQQSPMPQAPVAAPVKK